MSPKDAARDADPAYPVSPPTGESSESKNDMKSKSLMRRLFRAFTQLGLIGGILLAGLFGAFFINSLEASKPVGEEGHEHGHGHEEEGHGHGGHEHGSGKMGRTVSFSEKAFKNANLGLATAGPVVLHPQLVLNGIITPNEDRVVQISPRFPGVVRQIAKRLGEPVKRGDILLSIEGDENLKRYYVNSAIEGTVISRRVGLGEHVERNDRLMVIADLRSVWVDFRVFARDFKLLKLHQPIDITLSSGGPSVKARIAYISPIGMADTQSMLARAIVKNPDGRLRPGLFVTGRVQIGAQKAFVAVRNSAIQYIDAKPVVFVEQKEAEKNHKHEGHKEGKAKGSEKGDAYEEHQHEKGERHKETARKEEEHEGHKHEHGHGHGHEGEGKSRRFVVRQIETGPTDGRFTEVYFGILPGEKYVAENSFMLKAELSKGMAAHSH